MKRSSNVQNSKRTYANQYNSFPVQEHKKKQESASNTNNSHKSESAKNRNLRKGRHDNLFEGNTRKRRRGPPNLHPQAASSSTDSSQHEERNQLDIPGFYYDKEKKRYFKIAPNHCANILTRDAVKKKEAEYKRQEDVKKYQEKKATKRTPQRKRNLNLNISRSVFSFTSGQLTREQLHNHLLKSNVSNLRPVNTQCIAESVSGHTGGYDKLEHTQMMLVNKDHNDLLCLWSLKETWVQRLQLVKLTEQKRLTENSPISVNGEAHGKVIIQSLNKVTDICWAPLDVESGDNRVLYTTVCHTGYLNSLAMIRSMNSEQGQEPVFLDYNLGKRATWSCAWNRQRLQFSVGSEKCALLLHVERRTLWEYYTNNSDPLSQIFSKQTGTCLHTGTRNGFVLTHDLRSRSTRPVCSLQHKSSVCSLDLLENDISLLASDFTGRICLWDLRNKKAIVEYDGNHNQYTKIPVHVDEREKIVYSVGEDGYTKFWCLRLGSLIHTIPPPCLTSRDTVPCVLFSMRWGNRMGNSGLLMGLEDKFHYYGCLSP